MECDLHATVDYISMLLYLLFSYSSFLVFLFRHPLETSVFKLKSAVRCKRFGAGVERRNERCWVVKKGGMIEGVIWDLTTKSSQAWNKVKTIHFDYCREKRKNRKRI